MAKKTYKIIHIDFPHPSFKWGNGLYAVIEERQGELRMCRINEEGKPDLFDDGRPMITCTGLNNPGITKTSLKITI